MRHRYVSVLTAIGVVGFIGYLVPYLLLQLRLLDGNGVLYTALNVLAAALVLISMVDQFNLASALIQTTWIAFGLLGLAFKAARTPTVEEDPAPSMTLSPVHAGASDTSTASRHMSSYTQAEPRLTMRTDWIEQEERLTDLARRGQLSSAELSTVLGDVVEQAQANSVAHMRLLITLLDAAPTLRSTISAIVLNAHDADDVLQETLLAVSHSLPSYRGEAPVLGWANGIARNKAKDLLRRKGRPLAPDPHDGLPSESERFSSQWATHEDVDRALATLSPKLRTVFELAVIDGLTYDQIAKELQIERNTVASRLRRARAQLQLVVAVRADG